MVPVLVIATFLTFSTMYLAPGGPVRVLLGIAADEETIEAMRADLGLDRPIVVQYVDWITDVVQGDLGVSIAMKSGSPVSDIILTSLPVTVELATMAMIITLVIGIPAGIISAVHRDTWKDHFSRVASVVGISMPSFWLGLISLIVFGLYLNQGWALSGYQPPSEGLVDHLLSLTLPALTLSVAYIALIARMTRSSMLDALNSGFVRNGRAMGLRERTLVYRDAFRNGFIPVFTVIGMSFGLLIRGTVLIEVVFGLPGIGKMVTTAAFSRDFPVIQGIMLVIVVVFVITNLVVDVMYSYIDPRISYENE